VKPTQRRKVAHRDRNREQIAHCESDRRRQSRQQQQPRSCRQYDLTFASMISRLW
jgi:hypothetical protein